MAGGGSLVVQRILRPRVRWLSAEGLGAKIAVVATHTPPAAAMAVAERLRRDVEVGARKALLEAQGARRAITVSMGVAGREAGEKPDSDLFKAAEGALRRAKAEGRNRVVLA